MMPTPVLIHPHAEGPGVFLLWMVALIVVTIWRAIRSER
jgi:hypothetical protein